MDEIITQTGATREASDPQAILGALEAVVYDWDVASDRLRWGPNAARTLRGVAPADLASGGDFAALVAPESEVSRYQAIFEGDAVDSGEGAPYRAQYRLRGAEGEILRIEDFGRWFADAAGRPARAHGLVRVVARIAAAAAAAEEAQTTLASRSAFNAFVDARCAEPRPAEGALALMAFGVANLAEINAAAGYDAADELIAGVGRTLSRTLRGGDRLVRYSGGKFALLIALAAKDQPAVAAARIAHRAETQVHKTAAGPLRAKIRVGVALSPRHGRTAHLLLQRADEAYAQTGETARVAVYALNAAAAETRRRDAFVADEIVSALNDRRLILAFQPVMPTGDLPPFEEAFTRLRMEDGALIGADAMIPAAERVGLVEMIDERVADLVAAELAADPQRRLSMNVSVASLRSTDWCDRLRARLAAAPGSAERLIVEIVETQAVENVAEFTDILKRIKDLGVRVAMDDFGAGHTSFRNLRSLGVDMVKIDGAFVAGLATSVDDRFFVRTLASLARHLGILTVAEWVEDEESVRLLREWGVDYLQGHHIGRAQTPAPAAVRASA